MPLSGSDRTSRSLLAQVRGNDAEAWDRLVQLYAPLVFHWCRRRNLHEEDIADVMHEVFQAVASNIDRFQKQKPGDTFRGWLRIITRNKVHDHFRRQRHEPQGAGGTVAQQWLAQLPSQSAMTPDDEDAEDGDAEADDDRELSADVRLVHRALDQIRGQFRERTWLAFWRTAVDGQSPADIADELSMTPGAVRVAKSRVLQRLREELGDTLE